ncbi:MAG: MgtC/SapB family protein [Gemmatimonadetes bacterium]|nr:MgtC/SapB family protein [Gemmatimonadota bacterium]
MAVADWSSLLPLVARALGAFLLALPVAWDRERSTRIMGLRTFPLVAVASFAYVTVGVEVVGPDASDAEARLIQGLMTGMGFIGGGAILKREGHVEGTATASSLWATGAMGAAVAFRRYDVAVVVSLLTFLVLRLMTPLEERLAPDDGSGTDAGDEGES